MDGILKANPAQLGPTATAAKPILSKEKQQLVQIRQSAVGEGKMADGKQAASKQAPGGAAGVSQRRTELKGMRNIEGRTAKLAAQSANSYQNGQAALGAAIQGMAKEAPANPFKKTK